MTISRKQQICLEEIPYKYYISRCVRRTFSAVRMSDADTAANTVESG